MTYFIIGVWRDDAQRGQPPDAAAVTELTRRRVAPRIQPRGSLRQTGEVDAFRERQVGGVLVEIGSRGGLGADEAIAVGKTVEIAFEDFRFVEVAF